MPSAWSADPGYIGVGKVPTNILQISYKFKVGDWSLCKT